MTLLDEINAEDRSPRLACRLRDARDTLSPRDQADLNLAINGTASAPAISRALKARGLTVSNTSVQRHRRGECACAAKS